MRGQGPLARSGWTMFSCCFAALGLIWMPLVLLRQLDAFVAFLTPLQLLRDAALAYVLLIIPAGFLTGIAVALQRFSTRIGLPLAKADLLAWSIVLVPTLWVCIWQLGGSGWAWAKAMSDMDLSIDVRGRVLASALLLLGLLLLIRSLSLTTLTIFVVSSLASLRRPAQLLFVLACLCIAIEPPRFLLGSAGRHDPVAAQASARPDIYLISIDTLAETDARVCGAGPTLMPHLREFAQRASCFTRHYATSNFTTPSTATMETGALPWSHWAVQIVAQIAKPMQSSALAERLREAGYETHSINANLLASPRHHGTESGYDSHVIAHSTSLGNKPREALTLFPDTTLPFWLSAIVPFLDTIDVYLHGEKHPYAAEYAYQAMLSLLDERSSAKPKFIWVHTLPPHDPYLPPPSTKYSLLQRGTLERWSEFIGMGPYPAAQQSWIDKYRLRYQESIMGADLALGELLRQLQARGRLANSLIIVTSDHGESFERGFLGHAGELIHNAVLQVPLVVKLPNQASSQQIDTPVSLADLAPTLVDLAGAKALPSTDGRSLRLALEGGALPAKPVFAMTMERQSRFQPLRAGHYAIIDGDFKLVLHLAEAHSELFNLRQDPHELTDLTASAPQLAASLRLRLQAALAQAELKRSAMFGTP